MKPTIWLSKHVLRFPPCLPRQAFRSASKMLCVRVPVYRRVAQSPVGPGDAERWPNQEGVKLGVACVRQGFLQFLSFFVHQLQTESDEHGERASNRGL